MQSFKILILTIARSHRSLIALPSLSPFNHNKISDLDLITAFEAVLRWLGLNLRPASFALGDSLRGSDALVIVATFDTTLFRSGLELDSTAIFFPGGLLGNCGQQVIIATFQTTLARPGL